MSVEKSKRVQLKDIAATAAGIGLSLMLCVPVGLAPAAHAQPIQVAGMSAARAAVSIASATVSVTDRVYTGKAVTPIPRVSVDGKMLVPNTDYTVSYKNNVNPGTASVTAVGI